MLSHYVLCPRFDSLAVVFYYTAMNTTSDNKHRYCITTANSQYISTWSHKHRIRKIIERLYCSRVYVILIRLSY